jgi:hypothetical protein
MLLRLLHVSFKVRTGSTSAGTEPSGVPSLGGCAECGRHRNHGRHHGR